MERLGKLAGGRAKTRTVRLLAGCSDTRLNNVVEALVRDACGEEGILHVTRAAQVSEFSHQSSREKFDLIILIPEHLRPDYRPQGSPGAAAEATRSIQAIKSERSTPIVVFTSESQNELIYMEAGAEYVLGIPFQCDEVKSVVRRLVPLSPEHQSTTGRWSFGDLLRGGLPLFWRS